MKTIFILASILILTSCQKEYTCRCTVDTHIIYNNSVSVNGQLYPTHMTNSHTSSYIVTHYPNKQSATCFDHVDHSNGNASTIISVTNNYPINAGTNSNQSQQGPQNFYQTVLVPYRSSTSYQGCQLY